MATGFSQHVSGKCPCCNNPWTAATGNIFAQMTMCQSCEETAPQGKGLSRSNMDFTIHPKDNFYRFANGTWLENNPIPPGYPNWNSFLTLHVQSQENLKNILEDLATAPLPSVEEQKVAAFYAAALDEEAIESVGLEPMKPLLDLCDVSADAYGDKCAFAKNLGIMVFKYGVSPFFRIGVSPDKKNSDHSILQVSQGGIGLPDRDYYFDPEKESLRDAYKSTVALFLTLLQDPSASESTPETRESAQQVYELEEALAKKHLTKTESRDPHLTYNKMTIAELTDLAQFDFPSYLYAAASKTIEELGDVNVTHTAALTLIGHIIDDASAETLRAYLKWCAVQSCAPFLSKAFQVAHFEFYEKTLMGTQEMKPRWKRAMAFTETALGEALGKLYCSRYFDEGSKGQALAIVESVRQALEDRLKEVDWMMSESTRAQALKKMECFKVKIGYPDKWIDYSPLIIERDDHFLEMVFKAREFANAEDNKQMNAPTDKGKWFMTPQTVNAYYHPNLNEIVFPAAILQPPFFNKDADDAVNYGAMGAVVGHEMTHAFDDKGRKFDADGILNDWWTEEDGNEYESRVSVMVEQANSYEVHGQHVQGKLTAGENIADLGGLRLAYRALKASSDDFESTPTIDGFTPAQRFFLSWAQCWRQNITKERSLQLLTIDPHGPNEMRCNGPLRNMPEFHAAFDVSSDDLMYRPPMTRVDIW